MAVNMSRSQRESLLEGATDGKYRKVRPDTDAYPLNTQETVKDKSHLPEQMNYGFVTQEIPLAKRAVPGC